MVDDDAVRPESSLTDDAMIQWREVDIRHVGGYDSEVIDPRTR